MRSKILRASLLVSMCAALRPTAFAAPDDALTLDAALQAALRNNPIVRQAVAGQNEARFAVKERSSQNRPKISQVDHYTTSDDATTQLPDSNQIIIQGDETIFQGSFWSDVRRLQHLEKTAGAELDQKRLDVALSVKETYYKALSASEVLAVWREAESEFSDVLRFVAPKFSVGSVPDYDYAKIRLTISQYQQNTLDTEKDLSHHLYTLGELMGTAPPSRLQSLPGAAPPPSLDFAKISDAAYPARSDLRAAQSSMEAERFGLAGAKRDYWPVAKVSADYGYTGQRARDLSLGWGVSGMLTLPLFDFGEIHSRVQQADARVQTQSYQLDALRLKVRTELNDQVQAVQAAWGKLTLIEKDLPEARKAYASSVRRYRTSLAPVTELSDAHDLWVQSRIQQSQALLDYRMALAELKAAQGLMEESK